MATVSLLLGFAVFALSADGVENPKPLSMSVDEFRRLSDSEQKESVARAFQRRLEHAANIKYEANLVPYCCKYDNGVFGAPDEGLIGSQLRHWRLGDSFRMDTNRGNKEDPRPTMFVASGYDSAAGVARSTVRNEGYPRSFGRVDTEIDRITHSNRYAYWLDGKPTAESDYLFRYLVDHRDQFAFEAPVDGDKIRLTVPWEPAFLKGELGKREYLLDPQKGFLPVAGKARWELKTGDRVDWRVEEFVVKDSKLVGDVWMPTKLTEWIGTSNDPQLGNVIETEVAMIEADTVTPQDLEIPFPPGMEIVDAIKGVAYIVDANNQEADIQNLVGSRHAAKAPKARSFGALFVVANIAVVLTLAALVFWRHRRRSHAV